MSALAGILNFDSAPVDEYALARLGAALNSRGPDGGYDLAEASVGMSYRAFHTNRESRLEVQPLLAREGHMLTWNGRLDNREELIRELDHSRGTTITDVAIVMAAYLKWNKACFRRFVGDFCLAFWDARLRVLYLVRDAAGTRALKYRIDDHRIIWSTETTALLGDDWDFEEEYIASAMSLGPTPEMTPFKNICAVKPAHVVTVTAHGKLSTERFWRLDPAKEIRYRTSEQYDEHALSELTDAVRCRLRSDRPVFAELSGGLDSSSIVCLSDKILKERAQAPGVETVSHVFDDSPTSDERKYIQLFEAQRRIAGHHIKDEDDPLLTPLPDDIMMLSPNPVVLSFGYHSGLCKAMDSVGSRVLLSG